MRCTRGSFACLSEPHALFLAAVCVRVAILLVGRLADALWEVRYTDVDYEVFTDGARFLASGGSPYDRATYRYFWSCLQRAVVTGVPVPDAARDAFFT